MHYIICVSNVCGENTESQLSQHTMYCHQPQSQGVQNPKSYFSVLWTSIFSPCPYSLSHLRHEHSQIVFTVPMMERMLLCVWQDRSQIIKNCLLWSDQWAKPTLTFHLLKQLPIVPLLMAFNIFAKSLRARSKCYRAWARDWAHLCKTR